MGTLDLEVEGQGGEDTWETSEEGKRGGFD